MVSLRRLLEHGLLPRVLGLEKGHRPALHQNGPDRTLATSTPNRIRVLDDERASSPIVCPDPWLELVHPPVRPHACHIPRSRHCQLATKDLVCLSLIRFLAAHWALASCTSVDMNTNKSSCRSVGVGGLNLKGAVEFQFGFGALHVGTCPRHKSSPSRLVIDGPL